MVVVVALSVVSRNRATAQEQKEGEEAHGRRGLDGSRQPTLRLPHEASSKY